MRDFIHKYVIKREYTKDDINKYRDYLIDKCVGEYPDIIDLLSKYNNVEDLESVARELNYKISNNK